MSSQSRGRPFQNVRGFEVRQQIGGGGFSKVYLGIHPQSDKLCAVKVINLTTPAQGRPSRKELEKEVKVHRMMKHDYVLEFIDAVLVEEGSQFVPGLFMLLEFAAMGDLFDKIVPDIGVNDDCAHFFFYQLIAGIEFIHQKGVAHRDIKPENLLLNGSGNLKISDFGLCSVFRLNGQERTLSGRCGSLPYIAPELNDSGNYRAEPVDVWGAGIVLFTLICGNTPWDEPTTYSPEYAAYLTGELLTVAPWDRLRGPALDIIQRILEVDPAKRISIKELWRHPWLQQRPSQRAGQEARAKELLTGMVESGEMDIAEPQVPISVHLSQARSQPSRAAQHSSMSSSTTDEDEEMHDDEDDTIRGPPPVQSQAYSQAARATQFTPADGNHPIWVADLTRCYSDQPPSILLPLLFEIISRYPDTHPVHLAPPNPDGGDDDDGRPSHMPGPSVGQNGRGEEVGGRIKFVVRDTRKQLLEGQMVVQYGSSEGRGPRCSLLVAKRIKGDPLEWRKLWQDIRDHELIASHVYNRKKPSQSQQSRDM